MQDSTPNTSRRSHTQDVAGYALTEHARHRMGARGIKIDTLEAVLRYGRVAHVRGAEVHVIGRKEISRYANFDIDLSDYDGIHAVCSPDRAILTVYRNRDLRGIRHPGGQHRCNGRERNSLVLLTKSWQLPEIWRE